MNTLSENKIINAEDYIIEAFKNCNIIGLGEGGHGLENSHEFFRKMFDNKKIQETIDIVIVEFVNADYQNILDKYIFGEEVDANDLRKSLEESTQPGRQGELSIYFELLKKIRNVNKTLTQNKKIRVLAGDPSIDWNIIHNLEEYKKQVGYRRETFPAELAIEFGINHAKKVLVIYSEFHLTKVTDNKFDPNYPSITSTVNKNHSSTIMTIGTIYSESLLSEHCFKQCPLYSVIDLANDDLGNLPAHKMSSESIYNIYKDDKEVIAFEGYKIKELFDALLYVGQYDSLKRSPMPEPDFDNDYWDELNRRRNIVGMKIIPKSN